MEKWDGTVLDIHATVVKLGDKCVQLPGMHALSGYDPVSYPYGKGKKSALKVLMNNDIDGLQDVLGAPDISQGQLKATAGAFFLALYGQKKTDSLNSARYKMYTSRKKPPPLKKLPPTDNHLQLHVLRAHLCFGRQQIRGIHQSTLVTSAVSVGMSRKAGLLPHLCPMHR